MTTEGGFIGVAQCVVDYRKRFCDVFVHLLKSINDQ